MRKIAKVLLMLGVLAGLLVPAGLSAGHAFALCFRVATLPAPTVVFLPVPSEAVDRAPVDRAYGPQCASNLPSAWERPAISPVYPRIHIGCDTVLHARQLSPERRSGVRGFGCWE